MAKHFLFFQAGTLAIAASSCGATSSATGPESGSTAGDNPTTQPGSDGGSSTGTVDGGGDGTSGTSVDTSSTSVTDGGSSDGTTGGSGSTSGWPEPEPSSCPMNWGMTADVSGTTPLGPFTGRYAWYGNHQDGEGCWSNGPDRFLIQIYETVPDEINQSPLNQDYQFLRFSFDVTYDDASGEWVPEPMPFALQLVGPHADPILAAAATFTFDALTCPPYAGDPETPVPFPVTSGALLVNEAGWSLEGAFAAPFCIGLCFL